MVFLQEHWMLVVVIVALLIYFAVNGRTSVLKFLLYAVTRAERELGEKTGQLKLSMAYEMFISKYPIFSKIVPFPLFHHWVKTVLVDMRNILKDNLNAKKYVEKE